MADVPSLPLDEELLRSLLVGAPEALLVLGENADIVFVNDQAEAMFGYPGGQLLGQPIAAVLPDRPLTGAELAHWVALLSALKDRTASRLELIGRHRNGTELPIEVRLNPVQTARGRLLIAAISDDSERRQLRQALDRAQERLSQLADRPVVNNLQSSAERLRRSEETLRRAQQVAHLGSWELDVRKNEFLCSAELFAIFGAKPGSELDDPNFLLNFIPPEEALRLEESIGTAVRTGGPFSVEYRLIRPDGAERQVLSQGEVVLEAGRPVRLVGTILDITERKLAERARDESLHWLRAVLAQAPVGMILLHGPQGERVEANTHAQLLLGHLVDRIEEYPYILLSPEGKPIPRPELPSTQALRGDKVAWAEYALPNRNGDLTPILLSAAAITDSEGHVQGAVVTFQDITAVKDLERLRAEWNSIIAHDLRQPLNVISLSAQALAKELDEVSKFRRPVDRIVSSASRLTSMINDLLDLSQIEARQLTLVRRPTDLLALLRTSVESMALAVKDRPFEVLVHGEVPELSVDADRIAQVLDNLLTNAIKYGQAGTPIVVEITAASDHVAVGVTNQGVGIAPGDLPLLFRRFRRTEAARHSEVQGVGLGLYITQQLITAHGGSITAESTLGGTTTFRFRLPIH